MTKVGTFWRRYGAILTLQILIPASVWAVVYVDVDNTKGPWDGKSWASAYKTVQEGIDAAIHAGAGQVWVAEGTYKPTSGTDRTVWFKLRSGVALYGGFKGTENKRRQRDWVQNVTILSGDIGKQDDLSDNSYHVVKGADDATIDGFTITGGNADGYLYHSKGAGMVNYENLHSSSKASGPDSRRRASGPPGKGRPGDGARPGFLAGTGFSPAVAHCIFEGNRAAEGGAMYNYDGACPTISHCTFVQNRADKGGAMLSRVASNCNVSDCTFIENYAKWRGGAVFLDYGASAKLTRCTFRQNNTDGNGAGIYVDDTSSQIGHTSPEIVDCTFTKNSAKFRGGGIANFNKCTPIITNCSFNGNTAAKGGGAISNDYQVRAWIRDCKYSGNSGGSGQADVDTDSTSEIVRGQARILSTRPQSTGSRLPQPPVRPDPPGRLAAPVGAGSGNFSRNVESILRRNDSNADGRISRQEAPELMKQRWARIDTNADGYIDARELTEREERVAPDAGRGPNAAGRGAPDSLGAGQIPRPATTDRKTGLIKNEPKAFRGYTLFSPIGSTTTYLIDNEGRLIHSWKSDYRPGQSVYLLPNGHLLRTGALGPRAGHRFDIGGAGGRVEEFTWDGKLVWEFEHAGDDYLLHHDIERLPNGNILMIAWERKTAEEAIAAGRDPRLLNDGELWPDKIIEVKPTGKAGGTMVWQWHIWDHLIQDFDPSQANYGAVSDHPELLDINYVPTHGPTRGGADWTHTNSIDYHSKLDQIMICLHGMSEIFIIDHSTTTEQAAGHTGGRYGKGGDILYRWGNPRVYRAAGQKEQNLFAPHDAAWIEDGLPGAGNITIFNNGAGRPDGRYSSVEQIVPPLDSEGSYRKKPGVPFGPDKPVWTYTAKNKPDFFSQNISGAQRLPNGNTLICSGANGTIFEVTADKQIVWYYVNPVVSRRPSPSPDAGPGPRRPGIGPGRISGPPPQGPDRDGRAVRPPGPDGPGNVVFRAYRYGPDYPRLAGKDLRPAEPLEQLTRGQRSQPAAPPESIGHDSEASAVFYVDIDNKNGPWNGESWATAHRTVQEGIDAAEGAGGGEVWVAQGTYKTTSGADPSVSFQLKPGIAVFGGFTGTETRRDQRDWANNTTILSADIGRAGEMSDNSYHVIIGASDAILDGFTVTGGNARPAGRRGPGGSEMSGPAMRGPKMPGMAGGQHTTPDAIRSGAGNNNFGGGMINFGVSPAVSNCTFLRNAAGKGGGMYNAMQSSPSLVNCRFIGNGSVGQTQNRRGGGMSNDLGAHPTLTNCTFIDNRTEGKGGAIYNDFVCSPSLTNCVFVGNAAMRGGAIGNDGDSCPTLTNCTFTRNSSTDQGAALYNGTYRPGSEGCCPVLTNCILWGNTVPSGPKEICNWHQSVAIVSYSLVEGGHIGRGNIDADPLFIDAEGGDCRLQSGSRCIDAGHGSVAPETDIEANPRYDDRGTPNGPAAGVPPVDIGAYERQKDSLSTRRPICSDGY